MGWITVVATAIVTATYWSVLCSFGGMQETEFVNIIIDTRFSVLGTTCRLCRKRHGGLRVPVHIHRRIRSELNGQWRNAECLGHIAPLQRLLLPPRWCSRQTAEDCPRGGGHGVAMGEGGVWEREEVVGTRRPLPSAKRLHLQRPRPRGAVHQCQQRPAFVG